MDCHNCKSQHQSCGSHSGQSGFTREELQSPQIALVGMPNVGKSVLFNALTGIYVTVSNYPGTTVEVSRGLTRIEEQAIRVIDTPGMYSLMPISDEERVSRDLLLSEPVAAVIHVVDAKNLARMLPLTFQLLEAGLPLLLALNMMDEAQRLGLEIDPQGLEQALGIPVTGMAAALNRGVNDLRQRIAQFLPSQSVLIPAAGLV